MIAQFPNFYPDELVYSLLSRYYAKSSYLSYIYAAQTLFKNKFVRPDIEFLNDMTEDAYANITRKTDIKDIINKHTMFNYYARFISSERRISAYIALVNMEGKHQNFLCIPKTKHQRFLRYCPLCVIDDREIYGETYWHRKHQMIGINICYRHFCRLKDSNVIISGRASPSFDTAEENTKDNCEIVLCKNNVETDLILYISDLTDKEINIKNNVSVGKYFSSKLVGTKYLTGKLRNMRLLADDFNRFYSDLNIKYDVWRLQKFFTNDNIKTYDACMMAMFLGISTDQLCNMTINEEISQVKRIRTWNKKPGKKTKDWKSIDRELYPKVEQAVKEIWGTGTNRPRRVSKGAVSKRLNLADKYITNLPECMSVVQKYSETQEEYWAREIEWAVNRLLSDSKVLNWKNIRDLINITRDDFDRAWGYIDRNTVERIKHLI